MQLRKWQGVKGRLLLWILERHESIFVERAVWVESWESWPQHSLTFPTPGSASLLSWVSFPEGLIPGGSSWLGTGFQPSGWSKHKTPVKAGEGSMVGEALALHMVPWISPIVISEYRARRKSWNMTIPSKNQTLFRVQYPWWVSSKKPCICWITNVQNKTTCRLWWFRPDYPVLASQWSRDGHPACQFLQSMPGRTWWQTLVKLLLTAVYIS